MTLAEALAALAAALTTALASATTADEKAAAIQSVADGLPREVRTALNNAGFAAGRGETAQKVTTLEARIVELETELQTAQARASEGEGASRGYEATISELRAEVTRLKAEKTEATKTSTRTSVLADIRAALSAKAKPIAVRALMGDAERRIRVADDGAVTALREDLSTHLVPTSTQTPAQALADDLLATLDADDRLSTVPGAGAGQRPGAPGGGGTPGLTDEQLKAKRRRGYRI